MEDPSRLVGRAIMPFHRALLEHLIGLDSLRERTLGSRDVVVAVIDGPVSGATLQRLAAPDVRLHGPELAGLCAERLDHGTVVALMLGASTETALPGLCHGCTILVHPALSCATGPRGPRLHAPEEAIAAALHDCLDQGASIINLSIGLTCETLGAPSARLRDALARASARDSVVVWAAGNDPRARAPHFPWLSALVPIAACDLHGRLAAFSNFGRLLARDGFLAPGVDVPVLGDDDEIRAVSGTSFAAPFATAVLALRCSYERKPAAEILQRLRADTASSRRSVVPPLLRSGTGSALRPSVPATTAQAKESAMPAHSFSSKELTSSAHPPSSSASSVAGATAAGCTFCGGSGAEATGPYIYAFGQIQARYPTLGLEKEVAQVAAREGLTGTDARVLYQLLSKPANLYIARRLLWVFQIEGFDTYVLAAEDPFLGYPMLVEAIKPVARGKDLDLVIGVRIGVSDPARSNGLALPIVTFDQIFSFEEDYFLDQIRAGDPQAPSDPAAQESDRSVFELIMQMADNLGEENRHRALNYLTVRYPRMYKRIDERQRGGFALDTIKVQGSPVSGDREVVEVILDFRHRQTDVVEREFVRVDVEEKYPFLVTPMQPYYQR